jgi:hypothetical protein
MLAFASTMTEVSERFNVSLETLDEMLRDFEGGYVIQHFKYDEDDDNCPLTYPEMLVLDGDQGAVIVKPDDERNPVSDLQFEPVFGNYCSVPVFALQKFLKEHSQYGAGLEKKSFDCLKSV